MVIKCLGLPQPLKTSLTESIPPEYVVVMCTTLFTFHFLVLLLQFVRYLVLVSQSQTLLHTAPILYIKALIGLFSGLSVRGLVLSINKILYSYTYKTNIYLMLYLYLV